MDAELTLRFGRFPEETKKGLLQAIQSQCRKETSGYSRSIRELSKDALEWLIDYQTGLLTCV